MREDLSRYAAALASYDRAGARIRHVDALYNRGNTLATLGRQQEALALRKMLGCGPARPASTVAATRWRRSNVRRGARRL